MKHKYQNRLYFAVILTLILGIAASAQSAADTDFQVWNDLSVNIPLDKKKTWTLGLTGVWRLGNDAHTSVDERVAAVLTRKLNKYFSVGAGYVYRASNPSYRRRLYESRYQAIAAATVPLPGKLTLVNRHIVLRQVLYSRPDTTIYRTRFWLKRPIKVTEKRSIEPFFAWEYFREIKSNFTLRNRYQAGITTPIYGKLAGDFFYLRQNETRNRPGTANVIGSSLRINL